MLIFIAIGLMYFVLEYFGLYDEEKRFALFVLALLFFFSPILDKVYWGIAIAVVYRLFNFKPLLAIGVIYQWIILSESI
jgi:hypothetical protein